MFGTVGLTVGVVIALLLGETLTAPCITLGVAAGALAVAGARSG